jgi:hypothetical protein
LNFKDQSIPSSIRHCERSEAIHFAAQRNNGLLRRFAPLRKRFAFVAGNDGNRSVAAPAIAALRNKLAACLVRSFGVTSKYAPMRSKLLVGSPVTA